MTEFGIGLVAAADVAGLSLACFLWMWGGRERKWIRRILGSLALAGTVNGSAWMLGVWDFRLILVLPALILGSSMGYGGETEAEKVLKRSLFACGMVLSGVLCTWILGGMAWSILILHAGVAAWTIWLGVKNPLHAAAEEVFVCLLLNTGLLMYPFLSVKH